LRVVPERETNGKGKKVKRGAKRPSTKGAGISTREQKRRSKKRGRVAQEEIGMSAATKRTLRRIRRRSKRASCLAGKRGKGRDKIEGRTRDAQ